MLASKLLSNVGSNEEPLYSDSVFSAFTYTGNGSTQTITNGIDLAGKGGLVWIKGRGPSALNHQLSDTARGSDYLLQTNNTNASSFGGSSFFTGFNSNGFGVGSGISGSGETYVSWTFRKAPKFFDVVTYTGNGTAGRQIAHSLGVTPGMLVVKKTSGVDSWIVKHISLPGQTLILESTGAAYSNTEISSINASTFTVDSGANVNASGATYVAYLFAHDTSTDGIIQCGSFTTDGSGNATVNLGWEPQYLMYKRTDSLGDWNAFDSMRGFTTGLDGVLRLNTSDAELASNNYVNPTATGFTYVVGAPASSAHIYIAIRRPNKPPTTGTHVYNATINLAAGATDFPSEWRSRGVYTDLIINRSRTGSPTANWYFADMLRGITNQTADATKTLSSNLTDAEATGVNLNYDGVTTYLPGPSPISYFFRRAPGVMDIVCYTGTGANRWPSHNLVAEPELVIIKRRDSSATGDWIVYSKVLGLYKYLNLYGTWSQQAIGVGGDFWGTSTLNWTDTTFGLGFSETNTSGGTYVAYMFATKAGISKVGSYTGNGSSQTINCGFTTGARFVLIKRTDSTGDWYTWDTVRGIVSDNDPHLSLNTTAAEVTTDDSIDPDSTGFIVNQVADTNINVTSATYIYLAFA